MRTEQNQSPLSRSLVGGVLMAKADYKFWVSSLLTCCHINLWLTLVLTSSSISNKSHLFITPWKRISLSVGLSVCPFDCPLGCPKSLIGFPLAVFGRSSHSPASPLITPEPPYLSGLEPSGPLLLFFTFIGFLWPLLRQSSLPAWPLREPCYLSRLDPDGPPWFSFGCCSCSPASCPTTMRTILPKWTLPV
jgi:hypothetical protein